MFNSSAPWIPYKIPPTPVPAAGKQYALSFSGNATPAKNPSQFLQWREVGSGSGLPAGATAREFSVCENGNPETYWMLTWDEEPVIPEEDEE
jgi:hypothetical protein